LSDNQRRRSFERQADSTRKDFAVSPLPERFGGIVPPVCTPLTESHEIDVASLRRLIGFHLDAGVHGLFMLGSTSETALLSDRQRRQVLETAVDAVGGRVPILAGTIAFATEPALDHARAAKAIGVDALVVTPPFYVRSTQDEMVGHFRIVREEIGLPVFAYDVPPNVHVKIERPTIVALARDGVIVGLKDSSGDLENFRGVVMDTRDVPGFVAFTGSELAVDLALALGAAGGVPGLANVDPAGYVRLYDAMRAGNLEAARREQERLLRLSAIADAATSGRMGETAAVLGAFKTALMLRGVIATNVMGRPLTRYNEAETDRVRWVLAEVGL
jgi:4-hydroxy-tetrahydrodipicolinate synthase